MLDGTEQNKPTMPGMSLRDFFAAHALTGYLAMHADHEVMAPGYPTAAAKAYQYADALLAERARPAATATNIIHHAPDLGGES